MLKQSLQQKLQQKISPLQIQLIKLLEIPMADLEQRIIKEIEENPALDETREENISGSENDNDTQENEGIDESNDERDKDQEEFSFDDYINDDDDEIPAYKLTINNNSKDEERREIPYSGGTTFYETLISQLGLKDLDERQKGIADYILGNIDEDGYMRREVSSLVDDIFFTINVQTDEKEIIEVLKVIQELDPAGVGARDLQECLLLQIKRKEPTKNIFIATKILEEFFQEFTRKHFEKIQKAMDISESELKNGINEILKLTPKPGGTNAETGKNIQTIIPDFLLDYNDGNYQLSINSRNIPELSVNSTYVKMLDNLEKNKSRTKNDKQTMVFVKQKVDSAKWFIDAIRQREETLLLTMHAIIRFQYEYFKEGDRSKLRPMILKDIADMTHLDISTISRVSNSKFIQTHFGIFPLRYFFSEGLPTDSGEEVSTREIKRILQECIDNEDKKNPMTDDKLMMVLNKKGYQIARRTVAKYREQLNIPVGRLRKEI